MSEIETIDTRTWEYCGYDVTIKVSRNMEMFEGPYRMVSCRAVNHEQEDTVSYRTRYYEDWNIVKSKVQYILGKQAHSDVEVQIENVTMEVISRIEDSIDKRVHTKSETESAFETVDEMFQE